MKTEIIINVASHESRIAILEDGRLGEILVERAEKERMVGDIYQGVVTAVLPALQAAFVDIGQEKIGIFARLGYAWLARLNGRTRLGNTRRHPKSEWAGQISD